MQDAAPVDVPILPASQAAHSDENCAPVVASDVPAGQLLQAVDPEVTMYKPGEQLVHAAAPDAEYFPELHVTQVPEVEAPVVPEALPAAQDTHVMLPWLTAKVPAGHTLQLTPPVLPP